MRRLGEGMKRWRSTSVFVLVLSAIYLYAFPSASLFYFGIVVLHSGVGILFSAGLLLYLFRGIAKESRIARIGWIALAAGTVLGLTHLSRHSASTEELALCSHRALDAG